MNTQEIEMINILISRMNKGITKMPRIKIIYTASKAIVSINSEMLQGGTDVYYGFAFVYRLICAVIKTNRALKRLLKKEFEKDNWL